MQNNFNSPLSLSPLYLSPLHLLQQYLLRCIFWRSQSKIGITSRPFKYHYGQKVSSSILPTIVLPTMINALERWIGNWTTLKKKGGSGWLLWSITAPFCCTPLSFQTSAAECILVSHLLPPTPPPPQWHTPSHAGLCSHWLHRHRQPQPGGEWLAMRNVLLAGIGVMQSTLFTPWLYHRDAFHEPITDARKVHQSVYSQENMVINWSDCSCPSESDNCCWNGLVEQLCTQLTAMMQK